MKKLKNILLVDDDHATNFINKKVITNYGCTENITVFTNAEDAIAYLIRNAKEGNSQPDLIFLDINMPAMNGWEFLEEYKGLTDKEKAKIVVVMLTTSLNPDDYERAQANDEIDDFKNKPLTPQTLAEILKEHFAE